jgi:hypothetical protein
MVVCTTLPPISTLPVMLPVGNKPFHLAAPDVETTLFLTSSEMLGGHIMSGLSSLYSHDWARSGLRKYRSRCFDGGVGSLLEMQRN